LCYDSISISTHWKEPGFTRLIRCAARASILKAWEPASPGLGKAAEFPALQNGENEWLDRKWELMETLGYKYIYIISSYVTKNMKFPVFLKMGCKAENRNINEWDE